MVARLFANPRGPVGFQELKNTSFFQAFLVTRDYKMGRSRAEGPLVKCPCPKVGGSHVLIDVAAVRIGKAVPGIVGIAARSWVGIRHADPPDRVNSTTGRTAKS